MSTVRLVPKTAKAKQRIKQWGGVGSILEVRDYVIFSSEQGPWVRIDAGDPHDRWIHFSRDKHFDIEQLEEAIKDGYRGEDFGGGDLPGEDSTASSV